MAEWVYKEQVIDWKEPASIAETAIAWQMLSEMQRVGGYSVLSSLSGITTDSLRWMSKNPPLLPYSYEFCQHVRHVRNMPKTAFYTGRVSTEDLVDDLKALHDYGYTYAEMARGSMVTPDLIYKIARGVYPITDKAKYAELKTVIAKFKRKQTNDMKRLNAIYGTI